MGSCEVHGIKPRRFLGGSVFILLICSAFTSADFTDLFDHSANRVFSGHDDQLFHGISPEKCAELCLKGTTSVPEGECLSFDYRKVSGGRCQLSRANKDTAGQALSYNVQFDHYEMKDIASFFTVQTDRVLPGHDDVNVIPSTVSPRTCALRCLLGEGSLSVGSCLSFDLDSRPARCLLSGDNQHTAGETLGTNTRFDYYQRNDFCAPDLCVHGTCSSESNGYTCTCHAGWGGVTCDAAIITPQSCADLSAIGIQGSNNYYVGHPQPFEVYCDMDTDGGGWTVIQRRQDGSVLFNKPWVDYVQGFGDASGELWLGLEHLHSLTTQTHELYIYLEDWEGNSRRARYSTLSVGDASSEYRLTLSGYSSSESTVDDDLTTNANSGRHSINNRGFATTDDGSFSSCANSYGQGGWWYPTSCGLALLNGRYLTTCSTTTPPSCSAADGIVWKSWKTYTYSLKKTTMTIRPGSFPSSSLNTCQNGGTLTPGTPGSGVYTCVCPAGYGGTYCEQACTAGEFGPGCTGTCHCASGGSVCDVTAGVCSSGGCEAGWEGSNCQSVCTSGTFGPDCASTCHCASGGSVCDVTTGICSAGGCAAGWKGSDCQTVCVSGEFGPDCTGTCHCASGGSVCDVMTGVCSSGGCEAGWKETDCQTPCSPGEFGPDCTGTCHCLNGDSSCNIQTGVCTGGCAAGWKGNDCQTVCESGEFGPGCTGTCHCLNGDSACNIQTGACTGGCAAGWKGDDCQTACSPGEFGPNCANTCHCENGDSVCPADTGVCTSGGCAAGWEGISSACQTACSGVTFGPDCSGTCHCENGDSACNSQTGVCTGGCAAGWKGNNCQTVCHSGEFGPGCADTCHCASGDSVCNIQTGVCSSGGCEAGWEGSNCQTVCAAGEFGPGCTGTCHCASGGSVCDVMTGVCSSGGCSPGWSGDSCQTGCADGTFGDGCTGICHCLNGNSVCSIETGECSNGGCAAGWKGNDCQTACVAGEFGPGCTLICHCASGGSVCDIQTGVCSAGGCAVGWEGTSCQMACDGSYGPDCSTMCGNCYRSQACNRFDGTCPTGQDHVCASGYLGEKCDQGCIAGTYGHGCQETCGWCKTDSTCNVATGTCQSGCQPPWDLDLCKEILAEVVEHPQDLSLPLSHPSTFTCVSLGEPLPTVTWFHGDSLVPGGDEIIINTTQDSLTHTVRSILTIKAVKREDNGQYQCRSINGTNSDMSQQAALTVLERPEDVRVTLTPQSSTTMQVAWTVGFTGNLDINASEVTHKRSDETSWGPWVTTTSTGTEGTYELTGLSPVMDYTVKVRVRNFQGWSDPVESKGRTGNAPSPFSHGAVIGGTVGGVGVLIAVIATSFYIWRGKKGPKQTENRDLALTNIGECMEPPVSGTLNGAFATENENQQDFRRLSQLKTVQDVKNFLEAHDLKELSTSFEENDVDGRGLRAMNDAILKELVPKAGPRARLTALLMEMKTPTQPVMVHPDVPISNLNYWEIPREKLKLGKRLGRGQFGEVRLGEVRNRGVTKAVAVKTLKDSASDSDKRDLLGELDILVTVGQHENIISLVGACSKDGPLSIVVEYAPNGCLKDWLVTNSAELNTDSEYENQPVPLSLLPMEQLVKFGIDVANGMSHLAAMQCVHRDLAARNILLGENLVAKVSDFGLSRDIYESSEYVKSTKSKLPLRWMAYESLFYNVYTSQSDVWSFGVLLWEIITLGKQPYEGMNGKRMMDMIKDGGRLEKPMPCPDEIYTTMTTCWKTLPEDRPSFPQLKSSLNRILQDFQPYTSLLK